MTIPLEYADIAVIVALSLMFGFGVGFLAAVRQEVGFHRRER